MVPRDEAGRRRKAVFQGQKIEENCRSFVEDLKNPIFAEDKARVEIDERECKSQFRMEYCLVEWWKSKTFFRLDLEGGKEMS